MDADGKRVWEITPADIYCVHVKLISVSGLQAEPDAQLPSTEDDGLTTNEPIECQPNLGETFDESFDGSSDVCGPEVLEGGQEESEGHESSEDIMWVPFVQYIPVKRPCVPTNSRCF